MDFVYLGKITSTHGIKGEVRILSTFDKKELVFKEGFSLYIGSNKEMKVINTYRIHKNYDMVTFKGINDINDVLKYKGLKVYIKRSDLNLQNNDYLIDDLIGLKVICDDEELGVVLDIFDNNNQVLLFIKYNSNYYIPYNERYIVNVDLASKLIITKDIKDLIL